LRQINLVASKVENHHLTFPSWQGSGYALYPIPATIRGGHLMNQTFQVSGMTCGHCEKAVTRAIKQADPQAEVKIDRSQNKVEVQSQQPRETLAKAIAEEGYAVAA
jgi:copper chaperone